jgi:predicted nucleic acid-binding protein
MRTHIVIDEIYHDKRGQQEPGFLELAFIRKLLQNLRQNQITDGQRLGASSPSSFSAVQAAKNFRALRERAVTVRKTIDAVIARHCIQDGFELLHSDREFDAFEHLGPSIVE